MRNSRSHGPPSTLSGSSSSGRGLVAGSHLSRLPPPSTFLPSNQEKVSTRSRTKVIVILGIALPVLACIIGISAWAVTTDVLRISPRAHDNPYNRYGHQGKTRIDSLQPRNDQDIDVFQLNRITSKVSTVAPMIIKVVTHKTMPKSMTTGADVIEKTTKVPKVSDILSRLISDMPIPKNPKNFVVFAPVADAPNMMDTPKGRRFDSKVVIHDGDDLMAEESSYSEEISRESPDQNTSFSRKRKSSTESFALKPDEMISPNTKQNSKRKGNRTPHVLRDNDESENPPQFRKSHQSELADTLPKTANAISNRNGRISGPVRNSNQRYNGEFSKDTSQQQEFDHRVNIDPHSIQHDVRPQREEIKINKIPNTKQLSHSIQNQGNDAYQVHIGNANQNKRNYNFQPASQNLPHSKIQQQQLHKSPPHSTEQQRMASHQTQPQPGRQLFHHPPPILGTPHHSSPGTGSQPLPSQHHKKYQPHDFRQPLAPQTNPSFPHPAVQPQTYPAPPPLSPNQGPISNSFSNNNMQKIASPHPLDLQNNGPQYFAPPPQTFHTKTSYDRPSGLSKLPSLSSYERVAQSAVDHSKDGLHHHHHHHHHHEPLSSNSDPIGDVNLSDVPRTNDADRLGTIGIGFGGGGGGGGGGGFGGGGARGITVQIGGGGGGMTGLLPLGALGIAKNIVASLLPRPTLGLNSKVYLGVEVGRGGLGLLG